MTATREAIEALRQVGLALPRRVSVAPAEPKTTQAAREVAERFGDTPPREPEPLDLDALNRRLVAACEKNRLDEISRRDWGRAPWVFWWTPDAPLIARDGFRTVYAGLIRGGARAGFLRSCLESLRLRV